jgi:hypothetical protein
MEDARDRASFLDPLDGWAWLRAVYAIRDRSAGARSGPNLLAATFREGDRNGRIVRAADA